MVRCIFPLLADPRAIPYFGQNLPLGATTSSACPIVADLVLEKLRWFLSMIGAFPVRSVLGTIQTDSPVAPRYFDVNMAEWRALCRRML